VKTETKTEPEADWETETQTEAMKSNLDEIIEDFEDGQNQIELEPVETSTTTGWYSFK